MYLAVSLTASCENDIKLEPVKNWFGFTRRERRSTSILLAIIFIIIGLRYVLPEQNIKIENWGDAYADTGKHKMQFPIQRYSIPEICMHTGVLIRKVIDDRAIFRKPRYRRYRLQLQSHSRVKAIQQV